ncbi:MAG: NfeD family protein [Acidobacteriota bacterium]
MPTGFVAVIAFLGLGYLLFLVEVVVPGGILGILGILSVIYGCYVAFELGFAWGVGSILASVVVFGGTVYFGLRSKTGRRMMLADENDADSWKSADQTLPSLEGAVGQTITPLRPAGTAVFGDRRVDVVSDSEFLPSGTSIRVIEVEGARVVVEAESVPEESSAADEPATDAEASDGLSASESAA